MHKTSHCTKGNIDLVRSSFRDNRFQGQSMTKYFLFMIRAESCWARRVWINKGKSKLEGVWPPWWLPRGQQLLHCSMILKNPSHLGSWSSWLWNPGQMPCEIQSRGISGPTKGPTLSNHFFKKKLYQLWKTVLKDTLFKYQKRVSRDSNYLRSFSKSLWTWEFFVCFAGLFRVRLVIELEWPEVLGKKFWQFYDKWWPIRKFVHQWDHFVHNMTSRASNLTLRQDVIFYFPNNLLFKN